MSFARYSREIKLDDLNNVHTFAVLAIPPGSRVLDLGAGDGSVARVLAERGCLVTAVEKDAGAVGVLASSGVTVLPGDVESLAADQLPEGVFDVVLLLDVLEHLVAPAALLARTPAWLAPGGRVLISVPNVAHAAVRLALLQGRFPRSDVGLLDRTHLQFFDRAQLHALVDASGLEILDVLTVDRDVHETEIDVDASGVAPEVLAAATGDVSARVYQFFLVARPAAALNVGSGLLQALQERQRAAEGSYRSLEAYATSLDAEVLRLRERLEGDVARRALGDAEPHTHAGPSTTAGPGRDDEPGRAASDALAAMATRLADVTADRDTLRRQLGERMSELQALADTAAVLLKDVAVQRGFAEALASQLPRIVARGGEAEVVRTLEAFEAVAPTPAAAAALAADAAELRRLQQAVAIRALGRVDAALRRRPGVRAALRAIARAFSRRWTPAS